MSAADRTTLQLEFDSLRGEIDRIADGAEFNGQNQLDGSTSAVSIQVGAEEGESVEIDLGSVTSDDLGIAASDISSAAGASAAREDLDAAIESISGLRGELGAAANRLSNNLRSIVQNSYNLAESQSRIADADLA